MDKLLRAISNHLVGISWEDLSTAEQQIVTHLILGGYLKLDENKEVCLKE